MRIINEISNSYQIRVRYSNIVELKEMLNLLKNAHFYIDENFNYFLKSKKTDSFVPVVFIYVDKRVVLPATAFVMAKYAIQGYEPLKFDQFKAYFDRLIYGHDEKLNERLTLKRKSNSTCA